LDYNVAQFAKDNSLTGLEFLVGIPGTIGGAVAMNAGAYLADFASVCSQVEMVDEGGIIHLLTPREIGFVYRGNTLPEGMIFTKAILQVSPGEKDSIEQKMIEISRKREETQPIRSKTSGSSFANPTGYRAWELIDQAGCRGVMVGDAIVSEKHCNFLINQGNATARDIEELGELVRQKVKANSGINLEWEIRIIGEHEKKI
jgi:UDP-N-acetylmuramate dehydrogenase